MIVRVKPGINCVVQTPSGSVHMVEDKPFDDNDETLIEVAVVTGTKVADWVTFDTEEVPRRRPRGARVESAVRDDL